MIPAIVYVLLIGHFLGDWLAQSDWMALNKSKNSWALGVHVTVNMAVLFVALALWHDAVWWHPAVSYAAIWMFVSVNWSAHFATDFVTSRCTSRLWFFKEAAPSNYDEIAPLFYYVDGKPHWFFCDDRL